MQICMDETLKELVDYVYCTMKSHNIKYAKTKMIADILRQYELNGDAVQYHAKGQVAWKATPLLLQKLADAEREDEDDVDEEDDDDMKEDQMEEGERADVP
jgi:hypothetical protein